MKITSEIIQNNLEKLESLKKDFKILVDYEKESDNEKLRLLYSEGRTYGLGIYMHFIDFIRTTKNLNQEVFYGRKISLKEFKETLVKNSIDIKVKNICKSKGKVSFQKFINSPKWDLYSGYRRRRGGYRYHDNFVSSAPIIANFCIQNEIEIEDQNRVSEWYRQNLASIDISIKREIGITTQLVDFLFEKLNEQTYDFRKINIENLTSFIRTEIERKMKTVEDGESVKLVDTTDYYSGLTKDKIYSVISKEISSGRLTVSIKNDLGFTRSYPYRIFETITNLRNSVLDQLLD